MADEPTPEVAETPTETPEATPPPSFNDALKARTEAETGDDDTAPAPTAPEQGTDDHPELVGQKPMPLHRQKAVLEKARKDAAEEAERKYAWAKDLNPTQVQQAVTLAQAIEKDPVSVARTMAAALQGHPVHGQRLREQALAILQKRQSDQAPEPDITVEGRRWYSAEQQAKREEWFLKRVESIIDGKIKPLNEFTSSAQSEKNMAAERDRAVVEFEKAKTWPHFAEYQPAVKAAYEEAVREYPEFPELALRDAYLSVLTNTIMPTLSAKEKAATLKELRTKAVAGTGGAHEGAVDGGGGRPKSMGDALRRRMAESQTA